MHSYHIIPSTLADVYHLYKGASEFGGLGVLNGAAIHTFHLNDYPAKPARGEITDAHRVYPGDGTAPRARILRDLREAGFRGVIFLELFNRDYWKQDAATVLRTDLPRMRTVVRASLEPAERK